MLHPIPKLKETPSQTAGPYVHIGLTPNFAEINGVYGEDPGKTMLTADTVGERIVVSGRIVDGAGVPVNDAVVELWQADAEGRFVSPTTPNSNSVPAFSGWGRQPTNGEGVFSFETIKPGRVQGPDGKLMAPHLALWIVARGINIGLQTRLYFEDEAEANATDFVLNKVMDPRRRETLIARREEGAVVKYVLDIHLQGPQETGVFRHMTLLSALTGDLEIEALLSDAAQLSAMLAFERALAEAEATAGLISDAAAGAVGAAIEGFEPDWDGLSAGMARDGVVVPALVGQLRARVAEPHGKVLHFGATSQDVIDTALMLQLGKVIGVFEARIVALLATLAALDEQFGTQALMAHTRMQAALPSTVSEKLRVWSEPLARHLQALAAARRTLLVVQLGGPVGDRASFDGKGDLVASHLAKLLDLGVAPSWHATRDPIVAFGSLLSLISGSLGKIGMDVALLAQSEVRAVTLTGGGGSSAMAHKSNPVKAEVLVSLARFNAGLAGTLHQALVHENERSGAAWTLEWLVLPQMLVATGAGLRLAGEMLEGAEFPVID